MDHTVEQDKTRTAHAGHRPKHITPEFWQDLISESQNFLSGPEPRVSQLWHHSTHVSDHSRDDPGCQTIATRDFRLLSRSGEVRRQIYEGCRRALLSDVEHGSGSQPLKGRHLNGKNDEDMIAASYGAYAAHVLVDDMRTEAGDALNTKMYRDFIFAIDKRYKNFKRLPSNNTRIYWDAILGCWGFARDSFCVSFFPCPWIHEDLLHWQPIFAEESIQTQTLYTGVNGILTDSRICQLFIRGVLVIVPTYKVDRHGYPEYKVRIMDPTYPHLGDIIFAQPQTINTSELEPDNGKGKSRQSPSPADFDNLSFRDLDNRRLVFRSSSGSNRPLDSLLFWQFVSAMVKITWQIHPDDYDAKLPPLHQLWANIWPRPPPSHSGGEHLTLGTTLAFSYLLNNPPPASQSQTGNRKPSPPPPSPTTASITDLILSHQSAHPLFTPPLPTSVFSSHIHFSPILLLLNEILIRTPHPSDSPDSYTVNLLELQDEEDEAAGMVTKTWHRCSACTDFERAILDEVASRGGDINAVAFVHHHVKFMSGDGFGVGDGGGDGNGDEWSPDSPTAEELGLVGVERGGGWDHRELMGRGRETQQEREKRKRVRWVDIDDCRPCERRAEYIRGRREAAGLPTSVVEFSHHMPAKRRGGEGEGGFDDGILRLGNMKLG